MNIQQVDGQAVGNPAQAQFRLKLQVTELLETTLRKESAKRSGRTLEVWLAAERNVMWSTARDFAQQHGLVVPLLADVERAERMATGHSDFGRKWPLYVAEVLVPM